MTVVLESGWTGGEYGPNNPRIGWNSTGKRGIITASSEASGYAARKAVDPLTYNAWRPTSGTSTFTVTTAIAETINYCGIAAHTLDGVGATVTFETFDGSGWVSRGSLDVTDNSPIMFLCNDVSTGAARISIAANSPPSIGAIAFGQAIEVPSRKYQGYTPIDLAGRVEFMTNIGQNGQLEGRSIRTLGPETSFEPMHVKEEWFRTNMQGFVEEARSRPFFLAERPQDYPDAVGYVFTDNEIRFQRTGPKTYGSFTL